MFIDAWTPKRMFKLHQYHLKNSLRQREDASHLFAHFSTQATKVSIWSIVMLT